MEADPKVTEGVDTSSFGLNLSKKSRKDATRNYR